MAMSILSISFRAFAPSSLINVTLSPSPNFSRFLPVTSIASGFVSMDMTSHALCENSHVSPPVPHPQSTTLSASVTSDLYSKIALMASLVGPGTSQDLIKSVSSNIYFHLLNRLFSIFKESKIFPTMKFIWSSTVSWLE